MKNPFKNILSGLSVRKPNVRFSNLNEIYKSDIHDHFASIGVAIKPTQAVYSNSAVVYVIDFKGDVMASATTALEKEVSAILSVARKQCDQVLIRLESPGGAAFAYGHAAEQINRLRNANIRTVVSVDRVAASGGYMMAAVADKIISSPLAIIGSIGVVTELPNFYNILKSIGIEYKQYTAGKYKRTISPFGEITQEGEDKFRADLDRMYQIFKDHIIKHRPSLDIEKIATGEHWSAVDALSLGLVDKIQSGEEYVFNKIVKGITVIKVTFSPPRPTLADMLTGRVSLADVLLDGVIDKLVSKAFYYNTMIMK